MFFHDVTRPYCRDNSSETKLEGGKHIRLSNGSGIRVSVWFKVPLTLYISSKSMFFLLFLHTTLYVDSERLCLHNGKFIFKLDLGNE